MPFYNTASPTPSTKNTINSVAVTYGIRDFLLNLNLLPTSMIPAGYPINTAINGSPKVGEPVLDTQVNSGANVVPSYLPLETYGIIWKNQNIIYNTFKDTSTLADNLVGIDYIPDVPYVSPDGLTSFGAAEWPQGIQSYPEGINNYGLLAKTNNALFKKNNVIKNMYLDESKQFDVADFISLQPIDVPQQIKGYLDEYGSLNLGQSGAVQAANVLGSALNGGLGFTNGGVSTNFDLRSSLAGRVLGATGVLKDTKLGTIGGQQLALALANNAAFNLQEDLLGALNVKDNILSLVKGSGFAGLRPSYKITVPESGLGRALDYTGKVLGFTLPRSYVTDNGSIFQTESGEVANIDRANSLIMTTGKGQLQALISNVTANQLGISPSGVDNPSYSNFRTGYAPSYYLDNKGNERITNGILYVFHEKGNIINLFKAEDKIIPDLNYLREEKIRKDFPDLIDRGWDNYEQNDGINVNKVRFAWGSTEGGLPNSSFDGQYFPFYGDKKNLLTKTQILFNSKGMKTIVNRDGIMGQSSTQIQTANGGGLSKGSAVLSSFMYDANGRYVPLQEEPETVYCRSWTTKERYDSVYRMVRSGTYEGNGLYGKDSGRVPFRFNTENTVLEDTGFVKIAPYTNEFLNPEVKNMPRNFMLSIENLAWNDRIEYLPKGERGPGDPLTGKQGRIMWFPPYDIQISESVSVDWESHKFIGRGENIYTYSNTERTGQLSFKIIVDHSTYMNTFRGQNGPDDNYVASFIAGCVEPDSLWTDKFTLSQLTKMATTVNKIPQQKKAPPAETPPTEMNVYFPNDRENFNGDFAGYENGLTGSTKIDYNTYLGEKWEPTGLVGGGGGIAPYYGKYTSTKAQGGSLWPDRTNWGLNNGGPKATEVILNGKSYKGIFSDGYFDALYEYMRDKCKFCTIEVVGYASDQGKDSPNAALAKDRATYVANLLREKVGKKLGYTQTELETKIKALTEKSTEVQSTDTAIIDYEYPKGVAKKVKVKISKNACRVCPKKELGEPGGISKEERQIACPVDTQGCKRDRYATVRFKYNADEALAAVAQPDDCIQTVNQEITDTVKQKFYNETMFFDKLEKADRFIFDKFREKIRFFHPAFHSTTPEGLNSRLTFLHQCTRQGPTMETQGANNLAFGRAPICILRVGDFFYTKIAIDNMSIDYEPLVWDLNPEGIGVQPMIANVSLSFKFIGAESLYGPINKLQNALSFNYYANTRVYEARADYITQTKEPDRKDLKKNDQTGAMEETTLSSKLSPTGLYFNNGNNTVNPEVTATFTKELSKTNSCDTNQIKSNDKTLSNEPPASGATTTGTTSSSEILNNSFFNFYYDKDGLLKVWCKDLSGLDNGWGYNIKIFNGIQFTSIKVGQIDNLKDIDSSGKLSINTELKRGTLDEFYIKWDGSKLSDIYINQGSPANLSCYSANTSTIKLDTLAVYISFFKNGEETINKSIFNFVLACADTENGDEVGDFVLNAYSAEQNKISCLKC